MIEMLQTEVDPSLCLYAAGSSVLRQTDAVSLSPTSRLLGLIRLISDWFTC